MKIGERIKERRKAWNMSVEELAEKIGVSISTLYRYENSSIEKIPMQVIDRLCEALSTTPASLMGNEAPKADEGVLPDSFKSPQEAMEFILRIPTIAAYGGYDPGKMSDEEIMEFANEILRQLQLVSYKYKK